MSIHVRADRKRGPGLIDILGSSPREASTEQVQAASREEGIWGWCWRWSRCVALESIKAPGILTREAEKRRSSRSRCEAWMHWGLRGFCGEEGRHPQPSPVCLQKAEKKRRPFTNPHITRSPTSPRPPQAKEQIYPWTLVGQEDIVSWWSPVTLNAIPLSHIIVKTLKAGLCWKLAGLAYPHGEPPPSDRLSLWFDGGCMLAWHEDIWCL